MRFFFVLGAVFCISATSPTQAAEPAELTAELNAVRARYGLPPLATCPNLNQTCQSWSAYMASTGQFRHGGGEHVIAWGQSSAREVVVDWINSPGHRAWLLSANTSVGWGVSLGRDGRFFWAGAFGSTSAVTAPNCAGGTCTAPAQSIQVAKPVRGLCTCNLGRTRFVERHRFFIGRCR